MELRTVLQPPHGSPPPELTPCLLVMHDPGQPNGYALAVYKGVGVWEMGTGEVVMDTDARLVGWLELPDPGLMWP